MIFLSGLLLAVSTAGFVGAGTQGGRITGNTGPHVAEGAFNIGVTVQCESLFQLVINNYPVSSAISSFRLGGRPAPESQGVQDLRRFAFRAYQIYPTHVGCADRGRARLTVRAVRRPGQPGAGQAVEETFLIEGR